MAWLLSESAPVARKTHMCNAYECIMAGYADGMYTYAELRAIARVRRQGGKILPGQSFYKQVGIYGEEFYTYRAHPELHRICRKYDLFDD